MLKLTSFVWWPCHKLTKCFHQNHLQFSAVLPPADNWTWSHSVSILSIGGSCKFLFLALIESCMAKSPCSKFETCNQLAVNLSPWENVTEDEKKMPCLRFGINWCLKKEQMWKNAICELMINFYQKRKNKSLSLPPYFCLCLNIFYLVLSLHLCLMWL